MVIDQRTLSITFVMVASTSFDVHEVAATRGADYSAWVLASQKRVYDPKRL
jgi:hypothetical protein